MKKQICMILSFLIILSSTAGHAANGDIIHIGLERIFSANSSTQSKEILQLIENGVNPKGFYKVVEKGNTREYINIVKVEEEQSAHLIKKLSEEGINLSDPDSISKYIMDNPSLGKELEEIEKQNTYEFQNIPSIGDQSEANYYGGNLKPTLKLGENYSPPTPGSEDNTTTIESLKSPEGSYGWKVKLMEVEEKSIPFNKELNEKDGYMDYKKGHNINVKEEKYLSLYAVTTDHRVKSFTSIELKPEMIKQPRGLAENLDQSELKDVRIETIKNVANAIKVTGIPVPADESHEYKLILKNNKENIYKDLDLKKMDFLENPENIKVEGIDEVTNKYIYVLKLSKGENPEILGYKELIISKENINAPTEEMDKNKYTGPVIGDADGSTKFTKLEGKFKHVIANKVDIPVKNADYSKIGEETKVNTDIKPTPDQKTLIGKEMLLVALDEENKVISYAKFNLTSQNVKGQKAPKLVEKVNETSDYNYTKPIKGSKENMTKIEELKPSGFNNLTKFMYQVLDGTSVNDTGDDLLEPIMIDSIREASKPLIIDEDIEVSVDNYLLILGTDAEAKIKAYGIIKMNPVMIKDPIAKELEKPKNYSDPKSGSQVGTIKFDYLKYGDSKFYYIISDKEIEKPESGMALPEGKQEIEMEAGQNISKDIEIKKETDPILKDEKGFTLKMMIYAVDDKEKIIGYKEFLINENHVKLPNATELPEENYGDLKPGNSENSTCLDELNYNGLSSGLEYYYKIVPNDIQIQINEKVKDIKILEKGKDLKVAKEGEFLLILAVDSENRSKYYKTIPLINENIRGSDADSLKTPQHYSEPKPGVESGSTMFESLSFGVGKDFIKDATQFMVKTSDKPFGKIEINKKLSGSNKYEQGEPILGVDSETNKYLLLLGTDSGENVKAYKQFTLTKKNIHGGVAINIPEANYDLIIGEKPSTTQFSKLEKYGLTSNMTWIYKWSEDGKFSPEIPYLNQIIDDKDFKTIKIGTDIEVKKLEDSGQEPKYGYILLYGVTNGKEVLGYKSIPVNSSVVKEHADELTNVKIVPGTKTDHTKVEIGDGNYKYIISKTQPDIPAKNASIEIVAQDGKDIKNGEELLVSIGQYLTIYKIDDNKKVQGYSTKEIKSGHIKQGSAEFHELNNKEEIEILEGDLNNGLYEIKISLTDAEWSENLYSVENVRNKLFDSFTVDKEKENWARVVTKLKETGRHGLRIDGKDLIITTTRTDDYDIVDEQRITLTIPAVALKDANNPIEVKGTIVVKPTVGATITGSIITNNRQSEINSGQTTIVVKLKDGSFKSWNNENKESLINGFVGSLGKTGKWESIKKIITTENVQPQGPQEVKITIPANIVDFGTTGETITLTIPKEIIRDGKNHIVATPRFEIRPDILRVEGSLTETIEVEAPLYKNILTTANKWIIDITVGAVSDNLKPTDLVIAGLDGLKATPKKLNDKQIEIILSGTSRTPIPENGKELEITVKGSAITEVNSLDSTTIYGKISRQDSIMKDLEAVTINVAGNTLVGFNEKTMKYSLNSRNGIDGDWYSDITKISNDGFKPGKVYVHSITNPKVFRLVAELKSGKAPIGVKIGEVNYELKTIALEGLDTNINYDFSIDGGMTWKKLTNPLKLEDNIKEIRVRITSTDKELYSLPTLALKFIDLSEVRMDVAKKEITNTLSAMQYKFGNSGTAKATTAGTTKNVIFEPGELIVFERTNPANSIIVGKVETTEAPKVEDLTFNIAKGQVTGGDLEFTITTLAPDKYNTIRDTEWKPTGEKIEFKAGTLVFRRKAKEKSLASKIIAKDEILPATDGPKDLEVDNLNKEIKYKGKSLGDENSLLEYRIGNLKDWKASTGWKDDKLKIQDQDTSIYVRIKAEEKKLSSKETKIDFTANIKLDEVELNLAEAILDKTTSRMEYSFNSTDGMDGDWKLASNGKTNIISIDKLEELEGKTIYIRQNKNQQHHRKITEEPIKRKELANKEKIKLNYKEKTISNEGDIEIEIKLGNGNWITVAKEKPLINVNFVSGEDIIYRTKASKNEIYSDSGLKEMVPFPGATPYVKYDDETNKVEKVGVDETATGISSGYEFKEKSSTNWLDVGTGNLKDKEFIGDVIVQIRKAASEKEVASSIKEISFTKNLDWSKIGFDKYGNPPQILNTEPEMEYQIFLKGQEPPKDWKKAVKGNTSLNEIKDVNEVLLILIRDSRTKVEREEPVYGNPNDRPVDLEGINYEIESDKIKFIGITNKMEYKKSTDSAWTTGSSSPLEYQELEPIELIIRDKNYSTKTRTIKVDIRATTPNVEIVKYEYKDDEAIDISLSGFDKEKMEYSIDGGINYITFPNQVSRFNISKNHKFLIRSKVIETTPGELGKLPSLPTAQLNGIYLGNIGINPMERKIEGTSALMEYSLNSNDGKDGTWIKATSPDTTTSDFTTGMTVWIREISKKLNSRPLKEKTERENSPTYDGSKKDISYNISKGTIENKTDRDLKYRLAGGKWVDLPIGTTASSVQFKAGDFHILAKGTSDTLDSIPVLVVTIKAESSAPTVEFNDMTNKIEKINDNNSFTDFEYKLSTSTNWIDGKFLKGEEFVGRVTVEIRKKATERELASQVAKVPFTELDLRKIKLSKHVNPHELNGTTREIQFKVAIDGVTTDGDGWTTCIPDLKGNTKLYYIVDGTSEKIYIDNSNFSGVSKIEIRSITNKNEIVQVPTRP